MNNQELIKTVTRVRNALLSALKELDEISLPVSEKPRRVRKRNKQVEFENNVARGTWRKPEALKKKKSKK